MNKSAKKVGQKTRRPRKTDPMAGVPRLVDIHVGSRLRQRRTLLGISQEKLGDAVGLTFQQIQKYERGANRVGASRLYEFSLFLDIPISYFFEEMPDQTAKSRGRRPPASGVSDNKQVELESDPLTRRETLELVRAYYKVTDPRVRKRVFELVKSLAKASG
jgi:transcriptional regulator with XRE-family HTH domain